MADEENDERGRAEQRNDNDDRGGEDEERPRERKEPARDERAPNRFQEERARRQQDASSRRVSDENRRADEPVGRSQGAAPRAALRENMVTNAVAFLNNPSVRASSSDKQVRFLRDHKNLTKDEIVEAYNRANLPIPAFPPQSSTPVQSTSSSQRTDNYRPAPKESMRQEYDAPVPSRPPLPPPGYGYPQPGQYPMYPPPPYGPYPPPPQTAVAPPPPAGYSLRTLMLTTAATTGLLLGGAYVAQKYVAPRFASSAAADTKARELPEPPAVEEVIKQRSAKLKEELLQEVQKTTKEQASSTNEAIASLKTLLQSTLEKKDTDLSDLKAEISTLKNRLRDMQATNSYKPSGPSAAASPSGGSSLPAWQREPQKPVGANRWAINEASASPAPPAATPSLTPSTPSVPVAPTAAPSVAFAPAAAPTPATAQAVAAGGTTPISTSPVQTSSISAATTPAAVNSPAAASPAPASATPSKTPGERPYSFQTVMDMVARGEVPPDVRQDIDDKPLLSAGAFPPKGTRDAPPKPYAAAASSPSDWASVRETAPPSPAAPAAAGEAKEHST